MNRAGTCARAGALAALILCGLPGGALAQPATCSDGDGDGYAVCVPSCELPAGTDIVCGDCNDADPQVNPGAAESCNFADDDCDGLKDDGFLVGRESAASTGHDCTDLADNDGDGLMDLEDPDCAAAVCGIGDPPGCLAGDAGGCCVTGGVSQCTADGSGTVCVATGPRELQEPEGPAASPSCFDEADNDCDELPDHADPACQGPEVCNGFDDDFDGVVDDGFDLGASCSAGVGFCHRTGKRVCAADGSAECGVAAGAPGQEGPAGGPRCGDGVDNDCDGLTDLDDPNCQTGELCDGLDNDGDQQVDEDFPGLGSPCTAGLGVCQTQGAVACSPDGLSAACSAVAALPFSPEGPSGLTCGDGLDNDCDGTVDLADASCAAAGLAVRCALPYRNGEPGGDCTGWHQIHFETEGASDQAVVTAELLAMDLQGRVELSAPVALGDTAHLASRTAGPIRLRSRGTRHQVFAPVPMLRVTVEDRGRRVQAYCSNIPYLQVIEPVGAVVSESEGDVTRVVAALPRVDPESVFVKVDGVNVLGALGKQPTDCTLASPCSGVVDIRGRSVGISELALDAAAVDRPAANTLSMTLADLGCGGHVFVVDADPAAGVLPEHISAVCHRDDVRDKGFSAGFAVQLTSPGQGEITDVVPTPVTGQACHGRPIAAVDINGAAVATTGQILTAGDGEDTADTYVLPIDVALPQTDLAADLAGQISTLGTFDRGSNRLVAGATDDLANRTFASRMFAVAGPDELAAPGLEQAALDFAPEIAAFATEAINDILTSSVVTAEIRDALVLGITPEALTTFFQSTCDTATVLAEQRINEKLRSMVLTKQLNQGCGMTVTSRVTAVNFNGSLSCHVTPEAAADKLVVHVGLPETLVSVAGGGSCKKRGPFGICLVSVRVNVAANAVLRGMRVDFDLTETQIRDGGESQGRFVPGTVGVQVTHLDVDIGCIAGFFIDMFGWLLDLFGIHPFDFAVSDLAFDVDLTEKIGIRDFTLTMKQIKMNEQAIAASNQTLAAAVDTVEVQDGGLTLSLKATFSATSEDPAIADTPGALLTPAPAPMPPQPGAGNTYFVVADDAFNQLFAAMTTQGELRTTCVPSGQPISALAPPDCDGLGNFAARGGCKALKGEDCATLPLGERVSCVFVRNQMADFNIAPSMELMMCGRVDVPPRLLIQDEAGTSAVETTLRLNDMFVAAVLDRNADGLLGGDLAALPRCLQAGADFSADCKLVAGCLDLNVETALSLDATDGGLRILPLVQGVSVPPRPAGAVCEGGINFGDLPFLQEAAASDPIDDIQRDIDTLTPPLQSDGLDLGGIVLFSNPRLIALETDGRLDFQDYIGVTGDIVAKP